MRVLDAEYEALEAAGDALDPDEASLEQEAIDAKGRLPACQGLPTGWPVYIPMPACRSTFWHLFGLTCKMRPNSCPAQMYGTLHHAYVWHTDNLLAQMLSLRLACTCMPQTMSMRSLSARS